MAKSTFDLIAAARAYNSSIKWEFVDSEGIVVSTRMPIKSAAGWYTGRCCFNGDFVEPYNRDSAGYFRTEVEAQAYIDSAVF